MIETKDALRASGFIEPLHNPELQDSEVADRFLEQIGLDVGNMRFMWQEIGYGQARDQNGQPDADALTTQEYEQNCLQRIWALEQWQPGSARELNKRNEIHNYGRIPLRSLKLQYQPANNGRFRRRIHVSMASWDYNGAFMDSMFVIDKAHERLPKDVQLHITEVHHIEEWLSTAEQLAHDWQRDELGADSASIVSFVAHGSSRSMLMYRWFGGRAGTIQEITADKAAGDIGKAVLGLAHAGTTLLLDSCETAFGSGSLAEAFHAATNLHVVAPKKQVETVHMRFTERNNTLEVTPGFYEPIPQGERYFRRRSPAVHYRPVPLGSVVAIPSFESALERAA